MAMTTGNLVKQVRERLQKIDAELERLRVERAQLKAAVSGEATKPGPRVAPQPKPLNSPSAAARKRMAAERKRDWAEVRKHGLKNLAELKAYKAKQAKARSKPRAKKQAAPVQAAAA